MNDWEAQVIELAARLWAEDARARLSRRVLLGEHEPDEEDLRGSGCASGSRSDPGSGTADP